MTDKQKLEAFRKAVIEVLSIVENSSGVDGWHLNGSIADWAELLPLDSDFQNAINIINEEERRQIRDRDNRPSERASSNAAQQVPEQEGSEELLEGSQVQLAPLQGSRIEEREASVGPDGRGGVVKKAIIAVYGPGGSGKTLNKQAIADHFGCSVILDSELVTLKAVEKGRVLSIQREAMIEIPGYVELGVDPIFYSIEEVKELLGYKWVNPSKARVYQVEFGISVFEATPQEAAEKAWRSLQKLGNPTASVADEDGNIWRGIVGERKEDQECISG